MAWATSTPGTRSERAELFDEPLIGRLAGGRRRYDRGWLTGEIEAHLNEPECRIVVLTGPPGAGKSALMAHLAQEHVGWLRYFIRRTEDQDSQAYRHEGGLASFLTLVGFQLMALHPDAFPAEDAQVYASVKAAVIGADAEVSAVRVEEWFAHPFRRGALWAELEAALVEGRASAVGIGRLIVDVAAMEPAKLVAPALLDPVRQLAAAGRRVVVLLDGLDELRFRDVASDVGRWLAGFAEIPSNLRIVVAARPETSLLSELKLRHKQSVRSVGIDLTSDQVRRDGAGYLGNLSGEPGIAAVLASRGVPRERFVREVSRKVGGNFLYLTMISRLLDAEAARLLPGSAGTMLPVPDLDWLRAIEKLPGELPGFFALLLWSVHNRIGGSPATRSHWDQLYRPLLGLLAVTTLPLTGRQFRNFGEIGFDQATVDDALSRLRFFLDGDEENGLRIYHTSMAEFLTAAATKQSDAPLYCDDVEWHGRITDHAIRLHLSAATWADADPYLRVRLPFHAAESGLLDDLVEDPRYLLAADPDALVPELGAAGRAVTEARLYQQVVPMLRSGDLAGARAHLKLYAEQAGLTDFAAGVLADPSAAPWLMDFTRWQDVQLRQVLGRHDGSVNAVDIVRDQDGSPLAVTGGTDGRIRVWDLRVGRQLEPLPDPVDGMELGWVMALAGGELGSGEPIAVTGDTRGEVRAWNLGARRAIGQPMIGSENAGFAVAAAFVGGAPHAVCRIGEEFRAWDLTGQVPAHPPFDAEDILRDEPMAAAEHGGRMVFAAVTRSEGQDGTVRVWDVAAGAPCGPDIQTPKNWITALALGEMDGKLVVAVADGDHTIQVFDSSTGKPVSHRTFDIGLPVVYALAMGTIDGHPVIAAGDEGGEIRFRELPSLGRFGDPVRAHDRQVTALAFHDDLLASAGKDVIPEDRDLAAYARYWMPGKHGSKLRPVAAPSRLAEPARSLALGRAAGRLMAVTADGCRAVRWDVTGGAADGPPLGGRNSRVCAVGVATVAGRTTALSATYDDATIRTWDIPDCVPARHPATGEPLVRHDIETVRGLAVTRLGDRAVAVCAGWGGIHVWDVATGEAAGAGLITGPMNVLSLVVGENAGRPVVACTSGSRVMIFDLETGASIDSPLAGARSHHEAVAIASARDRTVVVSGGSGLSVSVWDPASGREPAEIRVAGETSVLAATHVRGHPVAICSGRKGEVRLVDLASGTPGRRPAADPIGGVNDLAITAVSGNRVIVCATDHGVRILDLATGEEVSQLPGDLRRHEARTIVVGTLRGRPVAVAGGYLDHAWYLDSGEPLPHQPAWPESARSLAIADVGGRLIAVAGFWSRGVAVADLETGALIGGPIKGLPSGPIGSVGVATVSGRPVLVARTSMGIKARYLDLPGLPPLAAEISYAGFAEQDETPPPPALFPARRLTCYPHDGGWCMAPGTFEGQQIIISGHSDGEIDLVAIASGLPLPSLSGGTTDISALAYRYLGPRPVLAVGAIDGVVRVADLTDLSAGSVIRTLAPVQALALAEPDHCLIGTEKGLIAARLRFSARSGHDPEGVHLPVDTRAARVCPRHETHLQRAERAGRTVPRLCVKGVQLTWGVRKADSLSYAGGHCYVMPGRLEILAGDQGGSPLMIDLTRVFVEPVDDYEAYLKDGCHYGVAFNGDGTFRVLSCYRRSERDWLIGQVARG